jgi:hypothetical protein
MTDPGVEKPLFHSPLELCATAALSLLVYAIAQFTALSNPYVLNDDVRQQIYWMQKWQDSSLYPPDILNAYAQQYVPWGVKIVYRIAAFVMNPLLFSKVLTGIIFVCLGTFLFMIGRAFSSKSLGWACLAVYWLMPYFMFTISGGIARSFAFPLIVLFMLGWFLRKPGVAVFALLLQALLIPYVFVLCLAAAFVSWLLHKAKQLERSVIPFTPSNAALIIVGIVTVAVMKRSFDLTGFGPMVSRHDMIGNPLFSSEGRYEIETAPALFRDLILAPWEYIGTFHELGTTGGIVSVVLLVVAGLFCMRFADLRSMKSFLPPLVVFSATSLAFYLAAHILLLALFVPDRYVMYTVNPIYCILLAIAFHAAWRRYGESRLVGIGLLAAAFVLGTCRLKNVGVYDYSEDKALYEAVNRTPKTALIAAHPWTADNILTFGRRNVLVSFELAHPWAKGYWRSIEPRISDFLAAYYAGTAQPVIDFCRQYGIDFFVVDTRHFTSEFISDKPFIPPFDRQIRKYAARTPEFYLASTNSFDFIRVNMCQRLIDARSLETSIAKKEQAMQVKTP